MFWTPIRNLANFYNKIVTNISAAERIFDIMDTQPEIADKADVYELPEIQGEVVFDKVSFAYSDEPETMVLDQVSFKVKSGETIALVGPTGAGKTTIVNLISRFYDITKGDIYVDGHSLKNVSIHSLRKQMGIMTQDNFLFSTTLKENIKLFKQEFEEEEIKESAKNAMIYDDIEKMQNGIETVIGERGTDLSRWAKTKSVYLAETFSMCGQPFF